MRITDYVAEHRSVLRSKRAQARYDRIMQAIEAGHQTPAELGVAMGEPSRRIGATLRRMRDRGLVRLVYRWEAVRRSCEKENNNEREL
jgi:hypothetical protein